ncbi:hypothetical protein HII12_002163 [Brettanomyces bruxellensis]|uniref:DEBR0S3_06172g1_1 n=1 Tax=Dekkera bruxellensis TaxID=5007 RepID=A0A7D9GZW1_DEKBR|nr:hypothetical protein HII12_002163 [Brettanomyces bruxellensis]VUG18263.1 DEBR0S3_06172g1_1 [Brettanomyces bruxellensis]
MSANEHLLQHLLNTLSADNGLRTSSEKYLNELINKQPESLINLLELCADTSIPFQIRLVTATFVKNKVKASWFIKNAINKYLKSEEIPLQVKENTKSRLVETLLNVSPFDHLPLFRQLLNCLEIILRLEPEWDSQLYQLSKGLLQSSSNDISKLYVSLSIVYQIAKKHCFDTDNSFTETIAQDQFPIYEQMFDSNLSNIKDSSTASIFYLILKIYKFCTFVQLPKYLISDLGKLQNWCNYQLEIIKMEPVFITGNSGDGADDDDEEEEGSISEHDHMLKKCQKWSFANLYRLKKRHAKQNNKALNSQVIDILLKRFIPNILTQYLSVTGKRFTDICQYYLISFITDCLTADSVYEQYIKGNVNPILTSIIVPRLSCTDKKVEIFESDPVEYINRYVDSASLVLGFKSSDMAATEFVFTLCHTHFSDVAEPLFSVIHHLFENKSSNVYQVEAGLKLLDNSWSQMINSGGNGDEAVKYLILPQLEDGNHKWLQTLACDTISQIDYQFKDQNLLLEVASVVNQLIEQSSENLPLQLEAINALNSLSTMPVIQQQVSQNVTNVMQLLLKLNNEYELELTSDLMDSYILKFSQELEPYALHLSKTLNDQFLQGAQEFLSNMDSNNKDDFEKETRLSQLLSTLSSMVVSMNSQKETTANMVNTFEPSVTFVLDNAILSFLTDVMGLLETSNFVLKAMTPQTWKIYDTVLDSFENYGFEYFDNYGPYFQTVVNYGFQGQSIGSDQRIQKLLKAILNFYNDSNGDDEMLEMVYNISMLIVLNCENVESIMEPLLKPIFKSLTNISIDVLRDYLRLFLALFIRRPDLVNQLTDNNASELTQFVRLWFENSDQLLTTVFDLKLEILALISILEGQVPQLDSMKEVMLRNLLQLIEKLPAAIDKRVKLIKMENDGSMDSSLLVDGDPESFDIDDDEYAELDVDTPLDNVNVLDQFKNFVEKNQLQFSSVMGGKQ